MEKLKNYSPDIYKSSKTVLTFKVQVVSFDKTTFKLTYTNAKQRDEGKFNVPREIQIPWGNAIYIPTTSSLKNGDSIYLTCTNSSRIKKDDLSLLKGRRSERLPLADGSVLRVWLSPTTTEILTPDYMMGQPAVTQVIVPIPLPKLNHPMQDILRIGYTDLTTNAEALIVEQEVSVDEMPLVRNRGSIKKGHGHSLRKITIPLMFTDEHDTMKLCHLLRQVRHMPILPIENAELEGKGIDAIAITGVNVSTVEGFPGSFSAQVDAVEFDWRQLFPDDDSENFADIWCWPLFKLWCEKDSGRAPYPKWSKDQLVDGSLTFRSPRMDAVLKMEDFKSLLIDSGKKLTDAKKAQNIVSKGNEISKGWLPAQRKALRAKANETVIGYVTGQYYFGDPYSESDSRSISEELLLTETNLSNDIAYFRAIPVGYAISNDLILQKKAEPKNYAIITPNSIEALREAYKLAINSTDTIVLNRQPIFTSSSNSNNLLLLIPDNYAESLSTLGDALTESKSQQRTFEINPASYTIIAEVPSRFWNNLSKKVGNLIALSADQSIALPDDDEYWKTWIFDWNVENISCGFMNIFSAQQASSKQSPALQFMGGSDIQLRVAGSVFSPDQATAIQEMLDYVDSLARDFSGLGLVNSYGGFLHIENEIADLLGVEWVLPRSLQVTTVPEMPEERGFLLVFDEFDLAQDKREALNDVYPTTKKGMPSTLSDLQKIDDSILDRAIHLRDFDKTLKSNEVYPDLNLPTNLELNNFIVELRESLNLRKSSSISNINGDEVDGPYWNTSDTGFQQQVGQLTTAKDTSGFADPDFFCVSRFRLTPAVNAILESSHHLQRVRVVSQDGTQAYLSPGKEVTSVDQILNDIKKYDPKSYESQKKLYERYNTLPNTRTKASSSIGLQQAGLEEINIGNEGDRISISAADVKSLSEASTQWGVASSDPTKEITRIKSIIGTLSKSKIGGVGNKTPLSPLLVNGPLEQAILTAARMTDVDPAFLKAIAHAESNAGLDPSSRVFNKIKSEGDPQGFIGIMQLNNVEARRFGVNILKDDENILGGARQVTEKIKAIKSRKVGLVAAAYNAGQGRIKVVETSPKLQETRDYTRRVFAMYIIYRLSYIMYGIQRIPGQTVPPAFSSEVTNLAAFALEFLKGQPPVYTNLTFGPGYVGQYTGTSVNRQGLEALKSKVQNRALVNSSAYDQITKNFQPNLLKEFGNAALSLDPLVGYEGTFNLIVNGASDLTKSIAKGLGYDVKGWNVGMSSRLSDHVARTGDRTLGVESDSLYQAEKATAAQLDQISDEWKGSSPSTAQEQVTGILEDNIRYEMVNRLVLAFPAYSVILVDGGRWLRAWKLFDRMFGLFGVSSLQIFKTREDPGHVAQVVFSNMYGRLTNQIADTDRANKAGNNRFTIPWIGEMISQAVLPTPTEEMLAIRGQVLNSLLLRAGTRIHIRLGYGSDPSKFPVAFNGTIIEVPVEYDSVRVVAIGDGLELKKDIAPQFNSQTTDTGTAYRPTALFGGGRDPRNTVMELFTVTADTILGDLANRATNGWYIHNNLNGIEHFGRPVYGDGNPSPGECGVNIYGLRSDPVNTSTAASNLLGWLWSDSDINVGISVPNATSWAVIETVRKLAPDFIASVHEFGLRSTLFMGRPYWNLYYDYDPVKVDALIESEGKTIFFDDPNNPGRRIEATNGYLNPDNAHVIMKKKVFQQLRVITSDYNLFETSIAATSEEVYTCCQLTEESAGFKSLVNGGKTFSTFRYFDNEIYTENMRVKTGQSNILVLANNQVGNTLRGELSATWASSRANENVTLSELKDGLKKMYKGHFLVRGDASYKPFDLVYVSDYSKNINGLCQIREVVHEFSMESGFVTTISPDICVTSTDPGEVHILTSAATMAGSIVMRRAALAASAKVFSSIKKGVYLGNTIEEVSTKLKGLNSNPKIAEAIDKAVVNLRSAGFFDTEKTGFQILKGIAQEVKSSTLLEGKAYTSFAGVVSKAQNIYGVEKITEVSKAASEFIKDKSLVGVESLSKLKASGSKFYEIVSAQSSVKGAMDFAKSVRVGRIIGSLGLFLLVDNVAEVFNRKLGARKSCILMPLRKAGKELTAGIEGHKGGVLGDPTSAFESSTRVLTNLNTADYKYFESVFEKGFFSPEAQESFGQSVVAGLLFLVGVQDAEKPISTWSDKDALKEFGLDKFRDIGAIRNVNPVVGPTASVPVVNSGGYEGKLSPSDEALLRLLPKEAGDKRKAILIEANRLIGTPYDRGWRGTPGTLDCSAFTQKSYASAGITIPRTAREQYTKGVGVTEDQLQTGDLIFFKGTYGGANHISHVGIYHSPGIMIHSSSSKGVIKATYRSGYFQSHFAGFRRIVA